jgi:recombination protein RecT
MVPFNNSKKGCKEAQFQLGYKGYIQLAIRSGYYKKINVLAIKEGELLKYDPLEEIIEVSLIEDDVLREQTPSTGYCAFFEYENGFRKTIYWSRRKMAIHAEKYSKAFGKNGGMESLSLLEQGKIPEKELWKYSSFWFTDFDGMALKTMIRQLISKWGIMSIELQTAIDKDMAILDENGDVVRYADNDDSYAVEEPSPSPERIPERTNTTNVAETAATGKGNQNPVGDSFFED